ncbi:uncharacterized protein MELLADRAFT_124353 [Melampsora larici-populina 98AG31]|uniref:Secreted protein n=1 Tax=Melampsora larici-populina (strain 98AG31 / pathotype 3-4-7) TaxID=747676 RepID=F4S8P0_MELLP|nr:uncharacterized protein MELLADRAFT_124353 [Melampsora larici-populina 98AG31]EGF98992.1 secreted protein [Melampsora larici-populina 98AG31]
MNAVSLIATILLICTSSATVQSMPARNCDGFVSYEPLIEGLDKQPFGNRETSVHKGYAGRTANEDDDDMGCCDQLCQDCVQGCTCGGCTIM